MDQRSILKTINEIQEDKSYLPKSEVGYYTLKKILAGEPVAMFSTIEHFFALVELQHIEKILN